MCVCVYMCVSVCINRCVRLCVCCFVSVCKPFWVSLAARRHVFDSWKIFSIIAERRMKGLKETLFFERKRICLSGVRKWYFSVAKRSVSDVKAIEKLVTAFKMLLFKDVRCNNSYIQHTHMH